jgi:hypothetical protein
MEAHCEVIWLPVRADLVQLVHDLNLGEKVIPVPLKTNTMTETVIKVTEISGSDKFLLGMPDTAFEGEYPYQRMLAGMNDFSLSLALWKTSPSQIGKVGAVEIFQNKVVSSVDKNSEVKYLHHWGAMAFDRTFLELLNYEMPHTGYGIRKFIDARIDIDFFISEGKYFDCGTFSEYQRFINTLG